MVGDIRFKTLATFGKKTKFFLQSVCKGKHRVQVNLTKQKHSYIAFCHETIRGEKIIRPRLLTEKNGEQYKISF